MLCSVLRNACRVVEIGGHKKEIDYMYPIYGRRQLIAAIVYSRQSRVSFDTLWLEDLYEKVVLETQGSKITPLVVNPGRILLTSSRLYFQPYNNIEPGLEVYCEGNSHLKHLYLSFKSPEERDMLYQGLIGQQSLTLDNTDQEMMTLQWQNGVISNYDYLMYLNRCCLFRQTGYAYGNPTTHSEREKSKVTD
uniref:BEACH-type PH domain-containing protein n=1 Tax=Timema tahoe TaxID=61484 RepID=A0A7R9IMA9_9NEOP|nr:unnamed protein product [Timema tahoe]